MIFRGIKTGNRIVFKALDTDIVTSVRQIVAVQEEVVDCLYSGYKWGDGVNGTIELYDDDYFNLLTYSLTFTGCHETLCDMETLEIISSDVGFDAAGGSGSIKLNAPTEKNQGCIRQELANHNNSYRFLCVLYGFRE